MRKVGPFLDCPRVNSMIQEHLIEDGVLNFAQFTTDFIKVKVGMISLFGNKRMCLIVCDCSTKSQSI